MSMADELQKLQTLREQGALTEDEFKRAKARVISGAADIAASASSKMNSLQRSLSDKWLGGVCGGLARATNIPTWAWRILFVLAVLLNGLGIVMYALMWIFVPQEPIRVYLPAGVPAPTGNNIAGSTSNSASNTAPTEPPQPPAQQ
jgi:phage shock protein C